MREEKRGRVETVLRLAIVGSIDGGSMHIGGSHQGRLGSPCMVVPGMDLWHIGSLLENWRIAFALSVLFLCPLPSAESPDAPKGCPP